MCQIFGIWYIYHTYCGCSNLTSVGVIVRNGEGKVMASMVESFQLPLSITVVEVIAAKKALQFAIDLGLSSIVLEGDSKITIDGQRREELSLEEYGHLLNEAKDIAKQFADDEFNHVLRQANKAAHNIIRRARYFSEFSVWMEDVPSHLFLVIQAKSAFDQ